MDRGLIYTNDKCIGCNKCVRVCSVNGANISDYVMGHSVVHIDSSRCISCGACFNVCDQGAREYRDDTEVFFSDLKGGEEISLLVAPSFEAKYPGEYESILGGLKEMGVKRIISVSFGADICTWAYLKLMRERGYTGRIATPCPVVVSYVEQCMPELVEKLMPVLSPMMCAATYCRKVLGITDRFAFIGPCIAKKNEIQQTDGLVQYNLTFPKLLEHMAEYDIKGSLSRDEIEYGLGSFYPAPGGLADNIKWFFGDDTPVRVISGKSYMYRYFKNIRKRLENDDHEFVLIDVLNCMEGCIEGTARHQEDLLKDGDGLLELGKIRKNSKKYTLDSPWNPNLTFEERLNNFDKQFAGLDLKDYLCTFRDVGDRFKILTPSREEEDAIFDSMYKFTEDSRDINCTACGYESCREMVRAIHNGFNTRDNCIYYKRQEVSQLQGMAFSDKLTGVLNRNALEEARKKMKGSDLSLGLVVADINGLKEANDTKGHIAGDRLICEAAEILMRVFGQDRVFRTGGDEFLVLMSNCHEQEISGELSITRDILKESTVSISLGYSFCEHYDGDFEKLNRLADEEMYRDKERYYRTTGKKRR